MGHLGFDITLAAAAGTYFEQLLAPLRRAVVGANMARLESESSSLSVLKDNISSAKSRIVDGMWLRRVPTSPVSKFVQIGTAMLAQANVLPQSALKHLPTCGNQQTKPAGGPAGFFKKVPKVPKASRRYRY